MTAANLGNILTFLVCPSALCLHPLIDLHVSSGAAGCSHLEGCGIHFREHVYRIFSKLPTKSTNSWCRISVTMMSRLMLNLRSPEIYISTRRRTATVTTPKHVVSTCVDPHPSLSEANEEPGDRVALGGMWSL